MTPREVGDCSLWQYGAAVAGWNAVHGSSDDAGITSEEEDDLWQGVMERMQ